MKISIRKRKAKRISNVPPGRLAEDEMIEGNRLEGAGKLNEAVIHYKNAAKYYLKAGIEPLAAKAYHMAGELYIKMNDVKEGLTLLENSYALYLSYGYIEDADKIRMMIDGYRSGKVKVSVALNFPNKGLEEEWQSVVEMASRQGVNIDRYVIALRALLDNADVEYEVKMVSVEKIISEASKYVIDVGGKMDEIHHMLRTGDTYYEKAIEIYRKDSLSSLDNIKNAKSEYSRILSTGYLTASAEATIKRRLEELNRYEYTVKILRSIEEIRTSLWDLVKRIESTRDLKKVEVDVERIYRKFSRVVNKFSDNKDKCDPMKIHTIERKISKVEEEFEKASDKIEREYQRREEELRIKKIEEAKKSEAMKKAGEVAAIATTQRVVSGHTHVMEVRDTMVSDNENVQNVSAKVETNKKPVITQVRDEISAAQKRKEEHAASQATATDFRRKIPRRVVNIPGKKMKVAGKLENYLVVALSYEERGGLVFHAYVENYSETTVADVALRFDFGTIMAETLKYMEHEPESILYKDGKFSIGTLTPGSSLEITITYDIIHYGMVRVEATFSGVSPTGERLRASGSDNVSIKKPSFRGIIRESSVHTALLRTLLKDLRYKDTLKYNPPPRYTVEEIYRDVFGIITRDHEHLREYRLDGEYESWFGDLSQPKYLVKLSVKRNEVRIEFSFENRKKLAEVRGKIDAGINELYEKKYKDVMKNVNVVNIKQDVKDSVLYERDVVNMDKK